MRIIQSDETITTELAEELEGALLSPRFPWYFQQEVGRRHEENVGMALVGDQYPEDIAFYHVMRVDDASISAWYDKSREVLNLFLRAYQVELDQLIQIKANLLPKIHREVTGLQFESQADNQEPNFLLIYYVNDSDGDTVLFDARFPKREPTDVVYRVTPKRGRLLFFDGLKYLAGIDPPITQTRVVINYRFTLKSPPPLFQ